MLTFRRQWLKMRAKGMTVNKVVASLLLFVVSVVLLFFFFRGSSSGSGVQHGEDGLAVLETPPPVRVRPRAIELEGKNFVILGKKERILSGAIHYFRVVPGYWKDRLLKLKAMGLNTVETYMPWNLHEPLPGKFDFTGILDVVGFVKQAQDLGLHVILRPGPYICAEWENGGLPAWLLHDPKMVVRSNYPGYMDAVESYFKALFPLIVPLQAAYGGPIIAVQIENEYGAMSEDFTRKDIEGKQKHLFFLQQLMLSLGIVELLFVSDGANDLEASSAIMPENVLLTVNFQSTPEKNLHALAKLQQDKPLMVMEFWTGWFDYWGSARADRILPAKDVAERVGSILRNGASINLYMFHGGTNFGFMNGANEFNGVFRPVVTSYDYGAPLSEAGDTTHKYFALRSVIQELLPEQAGSLPEVPPNSTKFGYGEVKLTLFHKLVETLSYLPPPHFTSEVVSMERLPINGVGQGYGYVMYSTTIPAGSNKLIVSGIHDNGVVLLNSEFMTKLTGFSSQTVLLGKKEVHVKEPQEDQKLDIIVENSGRINFGKKVGFDRKGITGRVTVDGSSPDSWKIYSFEFPPAFINKMQNGGIWYRTPPTDAISVGPALYKGEFTIADGAKDTFANMEGWGKGVLFINGVNVGRYSNVGPQKTLYIPAPLLRTGINKVMVFELHRPRNSYSIDFIDRHILNLPTYNA